MEQEASAREQGERARKAGIDSFTLKMIAIIGMTCDHIGIVFGDAMPLGATCALYAAGGLTFPIMAYLLGEGYRHTSNFKKYALRLLLFAIAAQAPYSLFLMPQGNVLFTLLLGLVALYLHEHMQNRNWFGLALALIILASMFLDWGIIGVPMVLLYYTIREKWPRLIVPYLLPLAFIALPQMWPLLSGDLHALPQLLFVLVGCTLTIPLLARYNSERGRPMKYFFYAYYPAHILVLGLIHLAVFGVR